MMKIDDTYVVTIETPRGNVDMRATEQYSRKSENNSVGYPNLSPNHAGKAEFGLRLTAL